MVGGVAAFLCFGAAVILAEGPPTEKLLAMGIIVGFGALMLAITNDT